MPAGRFRWVVLGVCLLALPFTADPAAAGKRAAATTVPDGVTLDARDLHRVSEAFDAIGEAKWSKARAEEDALRDPLARKLVQWGRLSASGGPASFEEVAGFIQRNPQWPRIDRLDVKAEARLSAEGSDAQVFDWFKTRQPRTALGKTRLAEALLARGRAADKPKAEALLHDAWVTGDFSPADEKRFLGRHGRLLTTKDHIARLDRLLWEGRFWSVKRILWRVPKPYQALGLARISLRRDIGNVDHLVSVVPKDLQRDPGLIYERLRWRRLKGKETAIDLVRYLTGEQPHADLWWEERSTLVRRALRQGYITDAYRIARNHGLTEGADFAEAEWLAGWVALRFLNEPKVGLQHFERLYAKVNYPVSRARAAYWMARSYEALKEPKKAAEWYLHGAEHPATYYGQLSLSKVDPGGVLRLPDDPEASPEVKRQFEKHELTRAYRILAAAGATRQQESMLRALLARDNKDAGWRRLTADLAAATGRRDLGVTIAKLSDRLGRLLPSHGYPEIALPHLPKTWDLKAPEKPLVLGMIRQESLFRGDAVSTARAQGLMQLMPATAKLVAKAHGLPFSKDRLVTDGSYNLTLGQSYLAGLMNDFDGSYVLSIAAYNAGPNRVRSWMRENGDPRQKDVDVIDWVEMIPFDETRNYVQRVMENLHVYRSRLVGTEVAFAPHADLAR